MLNVLYEHKACRHPVCLAQMHRPIFYWQQVIFRRINMWTNSLFTRVGGGKPWKQRDQTCSTQESSEVWAAWRESKHDEDGFALRCPKTEKAESCSQEDESDFSCNVYGIKANICRTPFLSVFVCKQTFTRRHAVWIKTVFVHHINRSNLSWTLPGLWWASEPGSCGRSRRFREAGSRPLRPPAQEPPRPPGWWSSPAGTESVQQEGDRICQRGWFKL